MNSGAVVVSLPPNLGEARARAFVAARRHSRRVRLARRGLELAVVGACLAAGALVLYRNFARVLRDVSFDGIGIEDGRILMDKPRLSGSRPGGESYVINAVKATQDPRRPGVVDLAFIGGDIGTPDHDVSHLTAESGHYESVGETLDLAGDVQLKNARYELFLRSVHVEFKTGSYVSKEPVKVHIFPDTTITGDSMVVGDGGAEAHFDGHVRTLIESVGGEKR